MSKRGTDSQLTKDNYDQEDHDSGTQMGTFKMASVDELARRPMKVLRRLGSKTLSNLSDDGKRPSPTASQSATPSLSSSSPSLKAAASSSTNPFANITFSGTPVKNTRISGAVQSSPVGSQSGNDPIGTTASDTTTKQKGQIGRTSSTVTSTATTKSSTAPLVSLSSSILAKGAFTFNIGSNANTLAITTPVPAPAEPLTIDREGYERSLRGVNQGFLKRIQRDLEHNAATNLAGAFEAYIEQRKKVKKQYPGIEEPQTIVMSGTDTSDITPVKKTFSGLGVNAVPGDTISTASGSIQAPPTSSPFANLAGSGLFGFGSSSIKGAIDPPRNPTSSAAWINNNNNTGMNGSAMSSSSSSAVHPFGLPLSATVTTNIPFSTSSTASPSTNAFANSSSATTNKPFSFQPKPFSTGRSGSMSGGSFGSPASGSPSTTPKPFVFQTSSSSQWTASTISATTSNAASSSSNHGDQDRVADDTKSEPIDSRKGEEDERTVYEVRAKLFGTENNEHKDLGIGQFRVNEHTVSKKRRMIMRIGGTGLITINSWIIQELPPQRNKNTLTIFAIDNGKPKRFMLRVKEEQTAQELLQALEGGQAV
ncbi:hypothetical protein BGZ91_010690 [Linnemannia elongata]|nr:hypothetical protein BGZ91_010690 [Linnemannia elongata]KAG0074948.1 hypothetical protein BGZ90_010333 [Linnemannia elongata]